MKTISQMTDALMANRATIMESQRRYESTLTDKERSRSSRNGNPNGGWVVPGNAAWTKAVKASMMPWDYFWSGSAPTPSTQYPQAIEDFLTKLNQEEGK